MILYSMMNLNQVDEERMFDVFFCAHGLEGRDTRVVQLCVEKKFKVRKWVIFQYSERKNQEQDNKNELLSHLSEEKTVVVNTSYTDTQTYSQMLDSILDKLETYQYIGFDITGFKNQFFFPLFRYISERKFTGLLYAYYTEPEMYHFPKKKENSNFFPNMRNDTKVLFNYAKARAGIEIKSIPGYEGEKAKKTILIIILGFDGKVAIRIKEEYNAEKVLLVNGFPSYLPKFRDISLLNNKELVSSCNSEEIFSAYADNPFEIYNVLYRIRKKYEDYKLLIAPLGAKPLALGVCKFAMDYPQTAVLYVDSTKYVEKNTENFGASWEYQLSLGTNIVENKNGE